MNKKQYGFMEKREEILFRFGELKSFYAITRKQWVIYCVVLEFSKKVVGPSVF